MARILLVEDDPLLGKGLFVSLSLENHQVFWEKTIRDAKQRNENNEFDLMILDVNLPDGSGLDFCGSVRESGSRVPILFLTARTDEDSVVEGLQLGANDYIRKPFSNRELFARIKTALREPVLREEQYRLGPILVLLGQRRVQINGEELSLNRREFDIFVYLVKNPKAVLSRDSIIAGLDQGDEINDRTIDSHLSHIRAKLKKHNMNAVQIKSIYGVGYTLDY